MESLLQTHSYLKPNNKLLLTIKILINRNSLIWIKRNICFSTILFLMIKEQILRLLNKSKTICFVEVRLVKYLKKKLINYNEMKNKKQIKQIIVKMYINHLVMGIKSCFFSWIFLIYFIRDGV